MKILTRKNVLFLILLVGSTTLTLAQEKSETEETAYRRSSLHTILLQYGDFLNKDLVIGSYNKAPFPDKYNDHRLAENSFDPTPYIAEKVEKNNDEEAEDDGEKKDKVNRVEKVLPQAIEKYFNENNVARQMVAKWFSRQDDGTFSMKLIHERGSYDATEMEAQIAKGSIRGLASLKDAGEELIKNTFVVVNKMNFVENEPIARATKEIAIIAANRIPSAALKQAAIKAAELAYVATKDGYSVWTVSYLYQLEWNDDIANAFYMDMWMDASSIDAAVKERFDTTTIFKLNYIGFEKAKSLVLIGVGKSKELIIEQATVRNVDKVYTKLQKAYDVFKTKTPIYSVDPLMAKIGLKEGVEANDKFEVLEQMVNKKTGLTEYVQVGVIKVDKTKIWDNRYSVGEEANVEGGEEEEVSGNPKLGGTYFKGGSKKIMAGMLLRQVK